MQGEFNDISTNNIKTTFNNTPNNIQLSDELTADPVYTRKMGTAYSIGKWSKRVLVAAGFTVTVTAAAVLSGGLGKNVFVSNPPVAEAVSFDFAKEESKLYYSFTIKENKKNYPITLSVSIKDEKPFYTLDCSLPGEYKGEVEGFEVGHYYIYNLSFSNKLDYKGSLTKGTIDTYKEAQ